MGTRTYRLTVVGCALAWFLVGLHFPALHEMTHHGRRLPATVIGAIVVLALTGVVTLLVLLRRTGEWRQGPGAGAAAT